MEKKANEGFTA